MILQVKESQKWDAFHFWGRRFGEGEFGIDGYECVPVAAIRPPSIPNSPQKRAPDGTRVLTACQSSDYNQKQGRSRDSVFNLHDGSLPHT
jgi:hypothetical protein